jgi:hypothetical protein
MPQYFFHVVSPNRVIEDTNGVNLVGPEAAHWHAVKLMYQMRYYVPDDGNWMIKIKDIAGDTTEVLVPSFRSRRLIGASKRASFTRC